MAMRYEGERTFPQPRTVVFEPAQRALPTIKRLRVKAADPASGRIAASKPVSFKSWGVNRQNVDAVLDAIAQQLRA